MAESEISSPLRISKKLQTRSDLLTNAIALFCRQGIRATRATEIAEEAGVSPATLFNYFATKDDLAEAWVRGEMAELLSGWVSRKGERSLRAGLRGFCRELAEANRADQRVRGEAWSAAGRAPADRLARVRPLLAWVEREQREGRLRSDLSAKTLAEMLIEALESGLVEGLDPSPAPSASSEPSDAAPLADRLRARVDLVLDGARKRNERVEAPSPLTTASDV